MRLLANLLEVLDQRILTLTRCLLAVSLIAAMFDSVWGLVWLVTMPQG